MGCIKKVTRKLLLLCAVGNCIEKLTDRLEGGQAGGRDAKDQNAERPHRVEGTVLQMLGTE